QGLIVPQPRQMGGYTWRVLSRRARSFESEADFAGFQASRKLRKEDIHPQIAQIVWTAFIRGEYDTAVFQSMKAVEVAVREASGLRGLLGVKLMRKAFDPSN